MEKHRRSNQHRRFKSFLFSPLWTRAVAGFAAIVIFSTTYWLILPASALTKNAAADVSGLSLEQSGEILVESEETPEDPTQSEQEEPAAITTAENADSVPGPGAGNDGSAPDGSVVDASSSWEPIPEAEQPVLTEETTPVAGESASSDGVITDSAAAPSDPQTTVAEDANAGKNTEAEVTETSGGTSADTGAGADAAAESGAEDSVNEEGSVSETESPDTEELSSEEETTETEELSSEESEEEDEEEEEVFGSGKLLFRGNNYSVTIEYGEDAKIPEAAELRVRELEADSDEYLAHYETAKSNAEENGAEVRTARFFDITIVAPEKDSDSEDAAEESWREIEPAAPVKVNIVFDKEELELPENAEVEVLHFADENNAEAVEKEKVEVETSENSEGTAVSGIGFDADAFSVFGVVGTEVIVNYLSQNGETYKISVDLSGVKNITEGAELVVEELASDAEENSVYVDRAVESLRTDMDSLAYIRLFDISIKKDGEEIEPDGTVTVKIELQNNSEAACVNVIHFTEDGPRIMDSASDRSDEQADNITFKTGSFSVYAVVGSGDEGDFARMNLHFKNGDNEIATIIVKNSDTLEELDYIIYDPGVGTIPEGSIFKGWTTKQSYEIEDAEDGMDIAEVRTWASERTISENEDVNLYAMIFKNYVVNYLDENNVGVGSDNVFMVATDTTADYTMNMDYNPKDDEHAFEGWFVKEGETNIISADPAPSQTTVDGQTRNVYKNGTDLTISGNVTFSVNAPEGHWLVFNENGKGASYNAPVFVKSGENTPDPGPVPTRFGYDFGGWYTQVSGTPDDTGYTPVDESSRFTFGSTISDKTTLYAKWTPAAVSNYTVSIWKQNVDGNGYDFAESVTLSGQTGSTIDTVQQQGTGDGAYVVVNGVSYNADYQKTEGGETTYPFKGFHLNEYDQNVEITPEGDAIVNVYYDRNTYTMRFFYARSYEYNTPGQTSYNQIGTTSNNGTPQGFTYDSSNTYYGYRNGNIIQLYYRTSNGRFYRNANYQNAYSGNVYLREVIPAGTRTFIQVNANNEGFLRHNGGTLERSLSYYLTNDYQRLTNGNTWKDVNNSAVNGNPLNLVSSDYLSKEEVSPGSININDVTTDVVTNSTTSSQQRVNTTYYYLDVKVRYGQSLDDLWPTPETTFITQNLTPYNRPHNTSSAEETVTPLLTGSWASRNNISGMYHQMATDLFVGDDTTAYFDVYWRIDDYYHYTYNVYFSALEDETGDVTYKGKDYVLYDSYVIGNGVGWGSFPDGSPNPADGGQGWHDVAAVTFDGTTIAGRVDSRQGTGGSDGTINVYYDRITQRIVYQDGIYVDGNNIPIQRNKEQTLKTVPVIYGTDLSTYNEGEDNYWRPEDTTEYIFEGWYLDSEGTQPYSFSGTMPQHDITVYAKWRQVQYRVFLHPNAGTDPTLDWGSSDQAMNFRVSYNGTVSTPTGLRDDYEFVGWYTDPSCTAPYMFNSEIKLREGEDNLPYKAYDKSEDLTDVMNKWGNIDPGSPTPPGQTGPGYNSDAYDYTDGVFTERDRYWITKKLDLYAKWRAKLRGTTGINVAYDPNGGTINGSTDIVTDGNKYLDQAQATAHSAPTAPSGKQFVRWVVQRWDNTEGKYVDTDVYIYPGDSFEVLKDLSKVEVTEWKASDEEGAEVWSHTDVFSGTDTIVSPNPAYPKVSKATYTVQVKAEYKDNGSEEPTHIYFYANDRDKTGAAIPGVVISGEGANEPKDETTYAVIDINQAVDILAIDRVVGNSSLYDGYVFLGWAKERDARTPWAVLNADGQTYTVVQHDSSTGSDVTLSSVTKIAADEKNPIENLYAVWKKMPGLIVKKTDTEGGYLDEAFFKLTTISDNKAPSAGYATGDGGQPVRDESDGYQMASGETGLKYAGLQDGIYTLTETSAPKGYIITEGTKQIYVSNGVFYKDADHTDPYGYLDEDGYYTITISNEAGEALPSTGGSGTRMFTILGGLLIMIAGALLFQRRRLL